MNILIDIAHPAHVHLLRNFYKEMTDKGHRVIVTVKDIPAAMQLLDLYKIPYIFLGKKYDNLVMKGVEQLIYNLKVWRIAVSNHIQLSIGTSVTLAHVSKMCRMKSIILDDDDDAVEPLFAKYAHPFADVILSPMGTPRKSKKTVYYPAYHELAYLYPARFTPDVSVLDDAGIPYEKQADGQVRVLQPYFVLRFNAFKAHHDVGVVGLTIENKRRLVELLSRYGKVFITTERNIDEEFKPYQLRVSPDKAHSLMYFATMLVGDSQTMTSESAVLGTPAIRCNTFVGRIHYLEEEEHTYQLTYGFRPEQSKQMFQKIEELLSLGADNLKQEWGTRRQHLLQDKIDYTAYQVWFVENYPQSKQMSREADDDFWKQFK